MTKRLLAVILLALGMGTVALGRIIGNGNSSVTVQRANDAVIDTLLVSGSSRFILGYFEGDLARFPSRALSRLFLTDPSFTQFGTAFQMIFQIPFMLQGISESVLRLQGYHKQRLIFEYPVGTILLRYDAALAEGGPAVRSFWSQVVITYGGFILSNELLVIPMTAGTMTGGAKLSLRGNTIGGASVGFSSLFGVGTDLSSPFNPVASIWQWASAELTLEGVGDWIHFDNVTRFSRTNGFDYSRFEIYFEPDSWPLSLLMTVRVLTEQETFALTALVDLDLAVLYLYANAFGLRGLSLQYLEITDQLTLGGILALAGGLYKARNANDIDLRARDYYIDIARKDSVRYEQTDYDAVVSLEGKSAEISFAGDLYFTLGNPMPTLLTGEVSLEIGLSKNIAFHAGLAVDPVMGLREFILLAEFWFSAL